MAQDRTAYIESRIFNALFSGLKKEGWLPAFIDTSDEGGWTPVKSVAAAKREFESVDMATIRVQKNGRTHGILLVAGNGIDLISDYGYTEGDPDGFVALMDRLIDEIAAKYE